jgi:hypothetical protein
MTEITEKYLVTRFADYLFFLEPSEPLYRLIKGGNPSLPVHSENPNAQVFQKLAELLMQDVRFGGHCLMVHGCVNPHFRRCLVQAESRNCSDNLRELSAQMLQPFATNNSTIHETYEIMLT